jgi:hypothetical protein
MEHHPTLGPALSRRINFCDSRVEALTNKCCDNPPQKDCRHFERIFVVFATERRNGGLKFSNQAEYDDYAKPITRIQISDAIFDEAGFNSSKNYRLLKDVALELARKD